MLRYDRHSIFVASGGDCGFCRMHVLRTNDAVVGFAYDAESGRLARADDQILVQLISKANTNGESLNTRYYVRDGEGVTQHVYNPQGKLIATLL